MFLNFEDRYIKPKKQNTARNVQLEVDSGVIAYIDNYNNAMKLKGVKARSTHCSPAICKVSIR